MNELSKGLEVAKRACLKQTKGGIIFEDGTRMNYAEAAVVIDKLFNKLRGACNTGICKDCLYSSAGHKEQTTKCSKTDSIMHVYDSCSSWKEDYHG